MIAHLAASTLVALVAMAAGMAIRGRSGAWRHALLAAAILRFAIPTPWLASAGTKLAPYARTRAAGPASVDRLADFLLFGDSRLGMAPARSESATTGLFSLHLAIWAAGFGLILTLWVRGLLRKVPQVREATLQETAALDRARRAFSGISAGLRIAAAQQPPGVRGIWRAAIILPDGLSASLGPSELEAVLLHELAHVRRRDNLTAAAAHLVACVFWFYPVIWWLERRMLCEREAACDEMALARGARAEEYLSGLVKVCRISFSTAAGYAGIGGSNFQTRMERIMSIDFERSSSPILRAAAAAVVALAVMIPVSGAFLKAQQAAPDPQAQILTPSETQIQAGRAMLKAGNPAGAPVSGAFLKAQQTAPDPQAQILTPAETQIQAGRAMLKAGNPAGAEEAFRIAHELDPKSNFARMAVVEALVAQGKTERAVEFLQQEMARSGSRIDLQLALGNTAVRAGKYELALTEFQSVLEALDPDSAVAGDVHMRIGETYRRMGKLDAAIVELQLAKNLLPDGSAAVVSTLGLCLESAGRWEEAEKEYAAAIRIDPKNAVALNNFAYLLTQHGGNLDTALTYAQRAAQAKPELPEVSDTLGTVYLAQGLTDPALEIFRNLLRKSPANAEHMALKLADNGQRDAVWADLTAALANHHSREDDQAIAAIMQKLK